MNLDTLQFSLIFLVLGTLLIVVFKKLKSVMTANGKRGFFYILAMALSFFCAGILTKEGLFEGSLVSNYILICAVFLIMGIFHVLALAKLLSWNISVKSFSQLVFTVVVVIVGSLAYLNASTYLAASNFHFFFLSCVILFFVPLAYNGMWKALVSFPVPIYQKWYYPLAKNISLPDTDELRNLRIISLEFHKSPASPKSVFKAKAPENMNFGKFFYHFINDYNHRSPESPIAYIDEANKAWGWSFYVKPNILSTTRNINPEYTVDANRIKENTTIICKRVIAG